VRGGHKKFSELLKKLFKISVQFWNFSHFKALPLWLDAAIPSPRPLMDTLSKIFNRNTVKGIQRFTLNLRKVSKVSLSKPDSSLGRKMSRKERCRARSGWEAQPPVYFVTERKALSWLCWSSARIAGCLDSDSISVESFRQCFHQRDDAGIVASSHRRIVWMWLKFQTGTDILYDFVNNSWDFWLPPPSYVARCWWRSWLRHCATRRKVACSISDGFIENFHWHNPSDRTMLLGLTQSLTEMSTRNIFWGVKAAGAKGWYPRNPHTTIALKSGSLNLLEPSGPAQASNGIAFTFTFTFPFTPRRNHQH